jgi:hypothetical protein
LFALKNISRYKAASIHLAMSIVIATLVLSVMLILWYPGPLFSAMGGKLLITLIVGVDVAIGPLITLIIFDTRKKGLVFDLAVVVALQLAALLYGVHTMYAARPAFTVFTGQQFVVVIAAEIDPKELAKARFEEFRHLSLTGPRIVATEPPTDSAGISDITFARAFGLGIQNIPKYYVPYADKRELILKTSHPLAELRLQGKDKEMLEQYIYRSGRKKEELHYLPVTTKNTVLTAIINGKGDLQDMLHITPQAASN